MQGKKALHWLSQTDIVKIWEKIRSHHNRKTLAVAVYYSMKAVGMDAYYLFESLLSNIPS